MIPDRLADTRVLVSHMIQETRMLLADIIEKTRASDERAKKQGSRWFQRHRLQVLLEIAEQSNKAPPRSIVAPWFIAELMATLDAVRRWRENPIWKYLGPSLANPTEFTHTILALQLAAHLEREGKPVRIVPPTDNSSPDLEFRATGGTQDWIPVECYQPRILDGRLVRISPRLAEKIVKQAMKKAKRQLREETPGILAICAYNQSEDNKEALKLAIKTRLQKTSRPNLCGVITLSMSVMFSRYETEASFTPVMTLDFVPNPSYFGRMELDISPAPDHPRLIRGPFRIVSASTESPLTSAHLNELPSEHSRPSLAGITSEAKVKSLVDIGKPSRNRAILEWIGEAPPPLLRGEGDINYVCGSCGNVIVEHVWRFSIIDIVLKCPHCGKYSESPTLEPPPSFVSVVAMRAGRYRLTEAIVLRRAACLVGLRY